MNDLDPSAHAPTVVKANSLIQAGYRLTLAEQRVLLSAISIIGKDEVPTDQTTYTVTANALADVTGSTARRAYQELAEAAHRLYRREVRIEGASNGEDRERVTMTRWVQDVQYIPDEGRVELRFAHSILPYLSLLQREFTSYKLQHVASMRSTHGVRLYELLAQWRQSGEREIEIEDLRRMFGVEGRYPSIKDLKKYVIEPAVRDVNECSDLSVEWGQRKAGRRVAAIQFRFEPKKSEPKKSEGKKSKKKQEPKIEGIPYSEAVAAMRPNETIGEAAIRLAAARR
jgi:plasmid replication initiation protein